MKPKILKIERVYFSDNLSILDMSSVEKLLELAKPSEMLLETQDAVFLLKQGVVFRYVKSDSKPQTYRVKNFWLNPDYYRAKGEVEAEELLDIARKEALPLFESENELILPSEVVLVAKKKIEAKQK